MAYRNCNKHREHTPATKERDAWESAPAINFPLDADMPSERSQTNTGLMHFIIEDNTNVKN